MDLGSTLRNARIKRGLRQRICAIQLGVSSTYLSLVERGRKKPSMGLIEDMCKLYLIPVPILFWFTIQEKDIIPINRRRFRLIKPDIDQLMNKLL